MEFAYPQGRIYLVLAFTMAALGAFALVRKRLALRRLVRQGIYGRGMLVRPGRQYFKCGLFVLAAVLLGIAMLGPQWGWSEEEIPPRRGRDVLIVLDVSRSMLAEDVAPNRLERAKTDLRELAGFLEREEGYRIGLVTFAERAAVVCPLTCDYRCFTEELAAASLNSLRLRGHADWGDGTQIRRALERGGQAIDEVNAPFTDVLLVSDGEEMDRGSCSVAQSLASRGITVHTVGLGDPTQGSLIPVRDSLGRPAYLRYQGELVHTQLQEEVLWAIAKTTHGRYFAARTSYLNLNRQFGELLAGKERLQRQASCSQRQGIHRFAWFVAPALVLLLLHGLISEAPRPGQAGPETPKYFSWVRRGTNYRATVNRGLKNTREKEGLCYLTAKCVVICALCGSVVGSSPTGDPWADFHHGNELVRQAQKAGTNANPALLVEARHHYQECLSRLESLPESGTWSANVRHNLEMAKLMLLQLGRAPANVGQQETTDSHSQSQESGSGDTTNAEQGSLSENNEQQKAKPQDGGVQESARSEQQAGEENKNTNAEKAKPGASEQKEKIQSSKQTREQQSQGNSEGCDSCQTGQNHSANGSKTKEGGDGSQTGRGTRSSSSLTADIRSEKMMPGDRADTSAGAESGTIPTVWNAPGKEKSQSEGQGRGPEPDASRLFEAERHGFTPKQPMSRHGNADRSEVGLGMEKAEHTTDPVVQAAVTRLQASIRRIENHRGRRWSGSSCEPEDPVNMNRYRDW